MLWVKSPLSYGHRLGYLQFNAGTVLKAPGDTRSVAQRIVSEVDMGLLVRSAPSRRDRILIEVSYAGGLRISELVGLSWSHVIMGADGTVQLYVIGKGRFLGDPPLFLVGLSNRQPPLCILGLALLVNRIKNRWKRHGVRATNPDPRAAAPRHTLVRGGLPALLAPHTQCVRAADHSLGTRHLKRPAAPIGALFQVRPQGRGTTTLELSG